VEGFLRGLTIDALWGVGPVTARKLRALGISTVMDLRGADADVLRAAVGSHADWLRQLARGIDDRPVVAEHDPKSSGSETTFARDLTRFDEITDAVAQMGRDAAAWLERRTLYARTVCLKVRYSDFTTITRHHSDAPTRNESAIVRRAVALLDRTEARRRPVRLLGVSVQNFTDSPEPAATPACRRAPRLPFDECET
jgi:DNA polymerase-4